MIDTKELRQLAQAASPGPWIAKNTSGVGLEIHMSHPLYPDKFWPAFGTDSAFCKKGLVSYETWTQFPHEVRDAQQSKNALFIAAANPAAISELLDRLEEAEKERGDLHAENAALVDDMNLLRDNNTALRAKIAKMEKQEPVGEIVAFGESLHEVSWNRGKLPPLGAKLYALPGAKGE